jgi:hypothetical protein
MLTMLSTLMGDLIGRFISTIAPSVVRVTSPHSKQVLKHMHDEEFFDHRELRSLVPNRLAAILVNKHRIAYQDTHLYYGISAEAPGGDHVCE